MRTECLNSAARAAGKSWLRITELGYASPSRSPLLSNEGID
jgi:hypothetical protein